MELCDILTQLCTLPGPSGFESPIASAVAELLRPFVDEVSIDRLGNVIGVRRCGKAGAKKMLLDAHLDEVGLIVTGIDQGFLRFSSIGGIDPRILPAREVTVLTHPEPLFGLVTCLPPHIQTAEERNSSVSIEELRIDVGLSQEEAKRLVPIGTPVVYRGECLSLAGGQLCGKAMDNRACFAALLRAAELLSRSDLDMDLYLMGSVQEEVSGAGAVAAANAIAPDCCVVIDATFARTPDLSEDEAPCALYAGPAVGVGPNMTEWMTELMIKTAKDLQIPYQLEVMEGSSGTNGWHMQICREGIPTSVVSLPLKYMHTPVETVSAQDVEHLAQLLSAFIGTLGREGLPCC